jgi:hypothetical protein
MAVTLTTAAQNAAANAVVDMLDAGGTIEIQAIDTTVLSIHTLAAPAFGAAANGVCTADTIGDEDSAPASGTPAVAVFKNDGGTEVFRCTAAGPSTESDIDLDADTITAGQQVSISAFTYTQPAS